MRVLMIISVLILIIFRYNVTKICINLYYKFLNNNVDNKLSFTSPIDREYTYKEIFIDKTYNGIPIIDKGIYVDIGANCGLFSIWVSKMINNGIIHTIEPSKYIGKYCKSNLSTIKNNDCYFHNIGISNETRTCNFNLKKNITMLSSIISNNKKQISQENDAIQTEISNRLKIPKFILKLLSNFYMGYFNESINENIRLIKTSDWINDNNIKHINCMKIDVEGSELSVLQGIDEEHFKIIDCIVMEVQFNYYDIKTILDNNNFETIIKTHDETTDMYIIFSFNKQSLNYERYVDHFKCIIK